MGLAVQPSLPWDAYDAPDDVAPIAQALRPVKPAAHKLRDYQSEAIDAVLASLGTHRSCMVVMATGLGKSVLFSEIARRWHGRVLVLAHRDELVIQGRDHLERATGEKVGVEQGVVYSNGERIVMASVQTIQRQKRMEEAGKFDLIIADEFHHYIARTYRKPLDYYSDAKVLGVTATADRGDEKALGQICDDVAYTMDIGEGIAAGWLVPIEARRVVLEEINLDDVGKSAGDLAAGQLDEAMQKACQGIVDKTLEYAPSRQGIVFLPGVRSSEYAAELFNKRTPGSAVCISGETEPDLRRRMVEDFRAKRVRYLVNCMIATEGFDAPGADLIVQGRPTLSRALYSQMIGRGTRPLPGVDYGETPHDRQAWIAASAKPNCLVLDFVGNTDKHSLITMVDVLGGDYTEAEVKRAKEKEKKEGGAVNAYAMLELARAELRALAARQQAQVRARSWQVDPFKVIGVARDSVNYLDTRYGFRPMTEGQRNGLIKLGFTAADLEGIGKRGAEAMFGKVSKRIERGLASFKQLRVLRKYAPCGDDLSFDAARSALDYIAGTGWKPQAERLNAILGGGREPGSDG